MSTSRRYCWRVGSAWSQESGTKCGECGSPWESQGLVEEGNCGSFTPCPAHAPGELPHGHGCIGAPGHQGDHFAERCSP